MLIELAVMCIEWPYRSIPTKTNETHELLLDSFSEKMTEYIAKFRNEHKDDYDRYEIYHIISGSTFKQNAEPGFYIADDFEGDESMEGFIDKMIKKYGNLDDTLAP